MAADIDKDKVTNPCFIKSKLRDFMASDSV